MIKPEKKSDYELFALIELSIKEANYVFLYHAKNRLRERLISDIIVLNILEGKSGFFRKRNKYKDKFEVGRSEWNYCIEGQNLEKERIRIIISFKNKIMPIITVMWIE